MADAKVSDFTSKGTVVDADMVPIVDSATGPVSTKKALFSTVATYVMGKLAATVHALTGKTTPADADEFFITDSAASYAGKVLTGTNLKAYLKTYNDTLYTSAIPIAVWRAHTITGYGSTNTKIPYFTTVVDNTDTASAFTVSNGSTNGLGITINIAGRYAISFSFNGAADIGGGLSVNSSELTTNLISITAANRLGIAIAATNYGGCVAITRNFSVNDVIRPHTNGASASTAAGWSFSICRVS